MIIYALKIRGKARIPDYVQLRDEQFTLLAYFRLDRPEKAMIKAGLVNHEQMIMDRLNEMPFGKMEKLDV